MKKNVVGMKKSSVLASNPHRKNKMRLIFRCLLSEKTDLTSNKHKNLLRRHQNP